MKSHQPESPRLVKKRATLGKEAVTLKARYCYSKRLLHLGCTAHRGNDNITVPSTHQALLIWRASLPRSKWRFIIETKILVAALALLSTSTSDV